MVWMLGPGVDGGHQLPFTESITCVFSLLQRTGWSASSGELHGLFGIGDYNNAESAIRIYANGSPLSLYVSVWHKATTTYRYQIRLGDEDGVSDFSADKWYQIGLSVSASGISYVVNGSTTPKTTITTNAPGALGLDRSKLWVHHSEPNRGVYPPIFIGDGWPTLVLGPAMYHRTALDFSSSTVRDRIWDTSGDFKNPGEDFSYWLGDTYAASQPDFAFLDGSPRFDNGAYNASIPQSFIAADGGGSGSTTAPGGLRKQYE